MAPMRTGDATPRAHLVAVLLLVLGACGSRGPGSDLRSPVPERRAAAVAALAGTPGPRDLPILLVAERDPSPLVRQAAARVFASWSGPRSVEALGSMLTDPSPEVAVAAARGLAAASRAPGSADARETEDMQKLARQRLVGAYAQGGPLVRSEIARALQALGTSLREAVESEARQLWERNARALEAGRPAERCGAAEELGKSGRADAVRRLLPLLDPKASGDVALSAAAARGLAAAGDRAARTKLEALLDADDVRLAEAAAAALGDLGDPGAAEALAEAGASGPARLAAAAVEALSALPQAPEVGVALCEIAIRTFDPAVAGRAARQARLREADCPERPLVARIARRGPDCAAALAALGSLGLTGARLQAPAERALSLVGAATADPALRLLAIRALGQVAYAPAAPSLLRRGQALVQKTAEVRRKWLPGRLATPSPFVPGAPLGPLDVAARPPPGPGVAETIRSPPEWIDDLDPADADELAAVAVALASMRAEGASSFAAPLAADPDARVRAGAVEAQALLGGDVMRARGVEALSDPSPAVRRVAAAALPRFGRAIVPALAQAVHRSSPGDHAWRRALARALGETGSPDAVPSLAALLAGEETATAATAIGRIGAREGARPLLALLELGRALARVEAIEALGQIGSAEAGPAIVQELTSDRPEVRVAAARALGKLRNDGAAGGLESLRSDYYADVRRAAVEALARLPVRSAGRR